MRRSYMWALAGVLSAGILAAGIIWETTSAQAQPEGEVALAPDGAPATVKLRQFDTLVNEPGCDTVGQGVPSGQVSVTYDKSTKTVSYTLTITGAQPNATYLLDLSECGSKGKERVARSDGGHMTTDAQGNGTLTGSYKMQVTSSKRIKASLVTFCSNGDDQPPTIPCTGAGFTTDSVIAPGR